MTYYDNRESVANIYQGLIQRGWNCYGYRADQSDSMTDYFSPASWAGIAEKNGFVLLVDVYGTSNSGYKVTKQTFTPDYSKIEKLQATIDDKATTPNEKEASQKIIDNMMNKQSESTTIIEEYPTFSQGNPKGCNWHIEKDGCIIAKGKGAYQCDGYLFGGYEKETMEKVNNFIDKIEKHISGKNQLVPVQEEVITTVEKPVQVETTASEFVKDQSIIKLNASFTGGHGKGTLLQLVEVNQYNNKTRYTFVKLGKKYQQLKRYGSANNTITFTLENIEKWISDSSILVIELKEVEEVTYKTVYKKATRQGQKENLLATEEVAAATETAQEAPEQVEVATNDTNSLTVELIHNTDKNGLELKFTGKPLEETRNILKTNGFKWSRYSKVWYIKNNTTNLNFAEAFVSAYNDQLVKEEATETIDEIINEETKMTNSKFYVGQKLKNSPTDDFPYFEIAAINESLSGLKFYSVRDIYAGEEIILHEEDLYPMEESKMNMKVANEYTTSFEEAENDYNSTENIEHEIFEEVAETTEEVNSLKGRKVYCDMGIDGGKSGIITDDEDKLYVIVTWDDSKFKESVYKGSLETVNRWNDITEPGLYILDDNQDNKQSIQEDNNSFIADMETQNGQNLNLQFFSTDTISNDFDIDSLLNKFENVEIENDTRISQVDKEYCEEQERMFLNAKSMLNKQINLLEVLTPEEENNTYYNLNNINSDIKDLKSKITKFKDSFIYNIIHHFKTQYNVTLEANPIQKKYNSDITYNTILDEIFVQLGGRSFTEKAVNEIKEASRKTVYWDEKITINKGKVSIADYIYWNDSWDSKYKSLGYSDSKVKPLFTALSHFETGSMNILDYYNDLYNEFYMGSQDFDIFSKYNLGYNKVNTFKNFKNGKIEIEFQTNEQAQAFVSEYLRG